MNGGAGGCRSVTTAAAAPPAPSITEGGSGGDRGGPPYASLALRLTSEPWSTLGFDYPLPLPPHPSSPAAAAAAAVSSGLTGPNDGGMSAASSIVARDGGGLSALVERVVALLLIRIVALASFRAAAAVGVGVGVGGGGGGGAEAAPSPSAAARLRRCRYPDLSTTSVAGAAVRRGWTSWPEEEVTPELIRQLRLYVSRICSSYWPSVHYHNVYHCYHVVISANKLMDLMLRESEEDGEGGGRATSAGLDGRRRAPRTERTWHRSKATGDALEPPPGGIGFSGRRDRRRRQPPPTYGLRSDPLSQLALIFAALIHDADHQGITNRQLVDESDELAILYNDQSVAEQRSLAVAFAELMRPEFGLLRSVLFPERGDYVRFRKTVIDLVLCTDIASPEQLQIVKSKWKEAFGETEEARERRKRYQNRRRMSDEDRLRRAQRERDERLRRERAKEMERAQCRQQGRWKGQCEGDCEPEDDGESLGGEGDDEGGGGERDESRSRRDSLFDDSYSRWQNSSRSLPTGRSIVSSEPGDDGSDHLSCGVVAAVADWRNTPADVSLSEPNQTGQLKTQFFRGRMSMGHTPMTSMDYDILGHSRHSAPQQTDGGSDGDGGGEGSYHDGDDISLSSASVSLSPSMSSSEGSHASSPLHDPNDGVIVTGVTLSRGEFSKAVATVRIEKLSTDSPGAAIVAPPSGEGNPDSLLCRPLSPQEDKPRGRGSETSHRRRREGGNRRAGNGKGDRNGNGHNGSGSGLARVRRRGSNDSHLSTDSHPSLRLPRRFSAPAVSQPKKYEFRLGIRRALDFTGSAIEAFGSRRSTGGGGGQSGKGGGDASNAPDGEERDWYDPDEPDDLRKIVVLEQLIRAADVSALMQDWENLIKWSSLLFYEQKASHSVGRGVDPQGGWVEGQITFIDSYALPLSRRLADTGVFGDGDVSRMFARCVEENRARWLREGNVVTGGLIRGWEKITMHSCQNGKGTGFP